MTPEGLQLRPFQQEALEYALLRKSTLLAQDMGLGKTPIAIVFGNHVPLQRVLIVCPASLRINWQREWEKWSLHDLEVGIVKDTIPDTGVVILSYDVLSRFSDELRAIPWDLVVYDEIHALSNPKTKRTRAVLGSPVMGVPPLKGTWTLGLSGTPIRNKPIEMWPALHLLDPISFPSRHLFGLRYCDGKPKGRTWNYDGASNLPELGQVLRSTIMTRHLKKDVLKELPPIERQVIELPANGLVDLIREGVEAEAHHTQVIHELQRAIAESPKTDDAGHRLAVQALAKARGVARSEMSRIRRDTGIAKVPYIAAHVREVINGGSSKVVLFVHHKEVVRKLKRELETLGVVTLTGSSSRTARQNAVDQFQTDPSIQVFLGNIRAAGVGITLTASHHVVFGEHSWVPADMAQAHDRAARIGQTHPVLIQYLVLEGSIEARMMTSVDEKQSVISEALDYEEAA